MNCNNTISDGFYFWIGKALAELSIGLAALTIFAIVVGGILLWDRSKK